MSGAETARRGLVRQWLEKATEDFDVAEFLDSHDAPYPHVIAFHAQQAAEKYLKALLSWRQVEFPKTHDLAKLLDLLADSDPALADTLREAEELTPFGVDVRYPSALSKVPPAAARGALRLAAQVRTRILGLLTPELNADPPPG